ncbi:MAG: hypothetical protein KGY67_00455 [Candidatus Thermoplasmatota archaeon]|nr:hypothetical protein [Candidatus Thermoplasmatota archaeon]
MITVLEFIEPTCPYCRYVYYYVLRDILVRRDEFNRMMMQQNIQKRIPYFDIKQIDIVANRGTVEEQWFSWYSTKIGGRYTPLIKINDDCFYLWTGKKNEELEEDKISRTDKLKSDIIKALVSDNFEKEVPLFDKGLMNNLRGGI